MIKSNFIVKNLYFLFADFTTLFSHLHNIQGSLETKVAFLNEITKESLRFKRRNLAALLEEHTKKIQRGEDVVINHKINHNGATVR